MMSEVLDLLIWALNTNSTAFPLKTSAASPPCACAPPLQIAERSQESRKEGILRVKLALSVRLPSGGIYAITSFVRPTRQVGRSGLGRPRERSTNFVFLRDSGSRIGRNTQINFHTNTAT